MAGPQELRLRWTPEEDKKLIEIRLKYHGRPWPGTAELAGLDRSDKSCWERYYNHLKPGINKANFSKEEDDTIIRLHSLPGNRWAFIAKNHLPWRTPNAIKNRYNNHLKKKLARSTHQNIPDTQLFHLNQNIPNASSSSIPTLASASQEIANLCFTSEASFEAHLAEFPGGCLLSDDEIIHHPFGEDEVESFMAGDVINSNEFMPTEEVSRYWSPLFEAWPELKVNETTR